MLFLAGAGRALAQENPPLKLTLTEAVRMALRQNPEVQIANLDVAESREDKSIARSALLPQATLQVSDAATRRNLEAFIGRRIPGFPQPEGPSSEKNSPATISRSTPSTARTGSR